MNNLKKKYILLEIFNFYFKQTNIKNNNNLNLVYINNLLSL